MSYCFRVLSIVPKCLGWAWRKGEQLELVSVCIYTLLLGWEFLDDDSSKTGGVGKTV